MLDRLRGQSAIEAVEFEPVEASLVPQSRVKMLITVSYEHHGGPTFEQGKEYWADVDVADSFILKGYAEGDLSREFSEAEKAQVLSGVQTLNLEGGSNG